MSSLSIQFISPSRKPPSSVPLLPRIAVRDASVTLEESLGVGPTHCLNDYHYLFSIDPAGSELGSFIAAPGGCSSGRSREALITTMMTEATRVKQWMATKNGGLHDCNYVWHLPCPPGHRRHSFQCPVHTYGL